MRTKAIKVRDIQNRIDALETMIKKESNKKERARLEDEQAALKLTLRLMPSVTLASIPAPKPVLQE